MSLQQEGLKLVLAGPVGSGKTTTLRSLADTVPVSTEMPLTEGATGDKTTTTVALDFATVVLDDGMPLQIFGLPGQEHLAHMREIVMNGAFGAIVLLPGDAPDIALQCSHWVSVMREIDAEIPLVVGVTRTDKASEFRMDTIRDAMNEGASGPPIPVFTIDARDPEQATQLVRVLLLSID